MVIRSEFKQLPCLKCFVCFKRFVSRLALTEGGWIRVLYIGERGLHCVSVRGSSSSSSKGRGTGRVAQRVSATMQSTAQLQARI